jgi:hypothetical protein
VKCKKFIDFHSEEKFLGSEVTQGKREMVAEGKWDISPTDRQSGRIELWTAFNIAVEFPYMIVQFLCDICTTKVKKLIVVTGITLLLTAI